MPQLYIPESSTPSVPLARGGEDNREKPLQRSVQVLQVTRYSSSSAYTVPRPVYTVQILSLVTRGLFPDAAAGP